MYVQVLWACVWLIITCVQNVSCNKIEPFSYTNQVGDVCSNILIHCLKILNMNGQCNKYNISIKLTCIALYLLLAHPVYWNMCLKVYELQKQTLLWCFNSFCKYWNRNKIQTMCCWIFSPSLSSSRSTQSNSLPTLHRKQE